MIKSCETHLNYVHKIRKKRLFSGFVLIVIAASIAAISINDYGGEIWAGHGFTSTGNVASSQKISDTVGDFTATLADDDRFGTSVASIGDLDNDGITDLVVGVPFDDDGNAAGDRGAVYILFMGTDGKVDSFQKISDTAGDFTAPLVDNDNFGFSVASIGDLDNDGITDLVVGVPLDDDGNAAGNRGAVYILFMGTDGKVDGFQKISDTAGDFAGVLADADRFGFSVASIGDLDNDGITDLVVGVPFDDDGNAAGDRGAVYILFMGTDGKVDGFQKISDTAGDFVGVLADDDFFGASVASIGDLDGDGIRDLVVGASGDDDGGADRGAVWILFMNTDGTVKSFQKISDTAGDFTATLDDSDNFGTSVADIGDLSNDGIRDLAVGVEGDDDGNAAGNRGAVYILFMSIDGTVKSFQKISDTAGDFTATLDDSDNFGTSVASIGDLDGDRITDLVVGVPFDDDGNAAGNRGAIYVLFQTGQLITSGQGDVFPPSFITAFAEDEFPITIDSTTFKMSDLAGKVDTVIVETGKSIQVKVLVSDETHSSEIQNVDLLTNLRGIFRTASDSDTRIHFKTGNPPTVVDPNGYFANVDVTSSEKGNKLEVIFDITFAKEMDTSDIIITAKDRSNNNSSLLVIEAWKAIKSVTVAVGCFNRGIRFYLTNH